MNAFILVFLAIGAAFGWISFGQRHHFSEGSSAANAGNGPLQRAGWVLLCSALWPLMLVSGAFGWWHRRARARSARPMPPRWPAR